MVLGHGTGLSERCIGGEVLHSTECATFKAFRFGSSVHRRTRDRSSSSDPPRPQPHHGETLEALEKSEAVQFQRTAGAATDVAHGTIPHDVPHGGASGDADAPAADATAAGRRAFHLAQQQQLRL